MQKALLVIVGSSYRGMVNLNNEELAKILRSLGPANKERAWELLIIELDKAFKDPKQNKKLVAALTHVIITAAWEAVEQGGVVGGVQSTVRKANRNRKRKRSAR